MKLKVIPFLLFGCLIACNSNHGYKFWDISKFNIVDTALKDNEPIKLLYLSKGPDNNDDFDYYFHIVAVSLKTGDTVNILTPVENGFTLEDKEKEFNYFDKNNIATKNLYLSRDEPQKDYLNKKIQKVARDPKFDNIADNKFPTVVGAIGISYKPDAQ
jgi:hypothetical protein